MPAPRWPAIVPDMASAVSALGAIVLAVSVFLPWYGVSFTADGVAYAQQLSEQVASQYGNADAAVLRRRRCTRLSAGSPGSSSRPSSAHQVLQDMNVVLLVLAGLGCSIALLALAALGRPRRPTAARSALLGSVAAVCVLYRMVDAAHAGRRAARAVAARGRVAGAARLAGDDRRRRCGREPRRRRRSAMREVADAWSGLSGWTPGPD